MIHLRGENSTSSMCGSFLNILVQFTCKNVPPVLKAAVDLLGRDDAGDATGPSHGHSDDFDSQLMAEKVHLERWTCCARLPAPLRAHRRAW